MNRQTTSDATEVTMSRTRTATGSDRSCTGELRADPNMSSRPLCEALS
jgi:hypothetical protein